MAAVKSKLGRLDAFLLSLPKPSFGKIGRNDPCPCGSGKK